jgi:AraC family transcriptional regulator
MLEIRIIDKDHSETHPMDRRIARAVQLIEKDVLHSPHVEALASHAGMSLFAFIRNFKRETGVSPWQFILDCRIEAAKYRLENSAKPISEIAFEMGWQNVSHFTALFRRRVGTTPGRFRSDHTAAHRFAA